MPSSIRPFLRQAAHHYNFDTSKHALRIGEMVQRNWFLGFTCFGGPAVHFQIFRERFVNKYPWIDDAMASYFTIAIIGVADPIHEQYKEMFALCQALPGPGSTKMIYAINLIHGGFIAGILSFFIWSLPGAIAAYGLAVGVSNIKDTLPAPVYALLSGLNASTVGIIALAAVQLSQKAITDKLTRMLVFLGGTAGMLYNALWYYPVLMVLGGAATIVWDYKWGHNVIRAAKAGFGGLRKRSNTHNEEEQVPDEAELQDAVQGHGITHSATSSVHRVPGRTQSQEASPQTAPQTMIAEEDSARVIPANIELRSFSWKLGATIVACFFATFTVVMILRGTLRAPPLGFSVFANLYLAGTIIFGGGPVVIPLLREYVVAEGWVSPRDFLLGLAICQAFPGPNFNFAVYLAALAINDHPNRAAGAVIGYIAIFAPGLILHTGAMGFWKVLRNRRWFTSCLRGVNATAVGLIYTAVYRLWEQGFLSEAFSSGSSLGREPWWVVVTATSFVGGRWFGVSPPIAILLGGAMGLIWYGVVKA